MAKRDSIESANLLNEILELYVNGYSRKQIVQYCSETHDLSERQVDNYLAKVYDEISVNIQAHKAKLIKQSVRRFNDLYERNSAIQDYRECRQVQESIIKLFGLSEPSKTDITTNGQPISTVIRWGDSEMEI